MRSALAASGALVVASTLGCAHGGASTTGTATAVGNAEVVVGPGALEGGDEVTAAWMLYGVSKARLYGEHPPPAANRSADDFALELGAREAQSAFWAERREKGASPQEALDRQVEIWRAGFLAEMVVALEAHPGWTIPPATVGSLRLEEFARRFAGNYTPGAPVAVKSSSGQLVPDVPGADFPDPEQLPVGPASCGKANGARADAWRRWEALLPSLGGAPVSATSPMHFGRQLIAIQRQHISPPAVTWVSERVAHLALVEGFCAVEASNWTLARGTLTRAIDLDPSNPTPHLELSLALTMLKRHDQALHEVDLALASSHDGCTVAQAWRRRGYILFELGALEDARRAYERSLTLDPDNKIALDELRAIAAATRQQGESSVHQPFEPPPPSNLTISTCPASAPPATTTP